MDTTCIFCRIVAGEVPSKPVYQDDRAFAFRDIHAVAPEHFLVIPREHVVSLAHTTPAHSELLGHLLATAVKVAKDNGLEPGGFRTVINSGAHGGQSVFHLHIHVMGGRQMSWPPG